MEGESGKEEGGSENGEGGRCIRGRGKRKEERGEGRGERFDTTVSSPSGFPLADSSICM